jgi:hypothetical protein
MICFIKDSYCRRRHAKVLAKPPGYYAEPVNVYRRRAGIRVCQNKTPPPEMIAECIDPRFKFFLSGIDEEYRFDAANKRYPFR